MAEPTKLSPKDVLSVLGEFERDISQREQERRGIRYVREVMQAYIEAEAKLADLLTQIAEAGKELNAIRHTITEERAAMKLARMPAAEPVKEPVPESVAAPTGRARKR